MPSSFARACLAVGLASLITGCQSIKLSLSEYPDDTTSMMEPAAKMPTESILKASQDRTKVILLRSEQSSANGQAYQELTDALTREVEAILAGNGVEIVDRSLAGKLDQEIKMCELQGSGKCGSQMEPSVARYAVKATITNASYAPTLIPAQRMTGGDTTFAIAAASYPGFVERYAVDGKNDQIVVRPHFNHVAQVSTAVRVYEVPSLRELKAVTSSGADNQRTADQAPLESQLLLASLKTAVESNEAKVALLNVFAPRGFVIGRRTNGKKTIFKVSMGTSQGLIPGSTVVIASEQDTVNPITKKASTDLIDVVKGKVSELVLASEAWVIPDDPEKAGKVSLGDQVFVKHEGDIWGSLRALGRNR
jgi:anti-anti-sigma regulatory factor